MIILKKFYRLLSSDMTQISQKKKKKWGYTDRQTENKVISLASFLFKIRKADYEGILKIYHGAELTGFIWHTIGPMVGSCEVDNEPSDSVKFWEFLD